MRFGRDTKHRHLPNGRSRFVLTWQPNHLSASLGKSTGGTRVFHRDLLSYVKANYLLWNLCNKISLKALVMDDQEIASRTLYRCHKCIGHPNSVNRLLKPVETSSAILAKSRSLSMKDIVEIQVPENGLKDVDLRIR